MNVIFTAGAETLIDDEAHKLLLTLAEDVAAEARQNVPVRTGALRDSITVNDEGDTVSVSADAGHALYVELGTSRMAAEPFLQPALFHERGA